MKKTLILFVLLFSSSVFADDILDFQIEGISIGDSLLDFFSEKEINDNIRQDAYIGSDGKFTDAGFLYLSSFKQYDGLQIIFKPNDKTYKVYSIMGTIFYGYNIDECYRKQKEWDIKITSEFVDIFREEVPKKPYPESNMGSSSTSSIMFALGPDFSIDLRCYDWDNELLGWQDYFQVGIDTTEYVEWNVEYHSNTTN